MIEIAVNIPRQIKDNDIIGTGLSSWLLRVDAVAKCYTNPVEKDGEIAVYKRLGRHKSILDYYGSLDASILLQFAPHGTVREHLSISGRDIPLAARLRWAEQATEAISFLYSKGVFHCDISYNNIFLDADCNALVGDFAGSSIDKEVSLGWYGTSHHHPDIDDPSEKTEIFSLGSTFFEILTGKNPFEGYEPVEIEKAIREGDFPTLDHLPALQTVIPKCWNGGYGTVDELFLRCEARWYDPFNFHTLEYSLISMLAKSKNALVKQQAYIRHWLSIGLAPALVIPLTWWIRSSRLLSKT